MVPIVSAVIALLPDLPYLIVAFAPVVLLTVLGITDWRAASVLERLRFLGDL